jgi:hypothetical protein
MFPLFVLIVTSFIFFGAILSFYAWLFEEEIRAWKKLIKSWRKRVK